MSGTKGPITTFIVEPFIPHDDEYYLSIVSDRLGANVSFSECGGIDIEENWDKVQQARLLSIIVLVNWGSSVCLKTSLRFYMIQCVFLTDVGIFCNDFRSSKCLYRLRRL